MLLTAKHGHKQVSFDSTDMKDTYKHSGNMLVLANVFWKQCKDEYLQTLQQRRKWDSTEDNVKVGDIVLLRKKRRTPYKLSSRRCDTRVS
jgi:hypothetical protein